MLKHSWLSILGSMLLATVVWVSVTLNNTYTARFTVPLGVVNLPADLAIAKPLPRTIEVELEGSGWQLFVLSAGRRLSFDLPGARLRSDRLIVTSRYLGASMKLPSGVVARQAFPETLTVAVDQYMQKRVPIRVAFSVLSFKPDYGLASPVTAMPDSVTLMGAEKVLRGIVSWPTAPLAFHDLTVPAAEETVLADSLPGLIRFRRETVRVSVPVEQFADMSFADVPVIVNDAPRDRQVLLANPTVTVFVRGGVDKLAVLTAEDFGASIEYQSLVSDTTGAITPAILLPAGVRLLKIEPLRIRYTIRQ
ncbi:MAG: hypothetical protein IPP94_16930 [Ignavibacteria bacterium]|nr:hypothetical protein [Ignavibacteria bacterium]